VSKAWALGRQVEFRSENSYGVPQTGASFLAEDVVMQIISERAKSGDTIFANALSQFPSNWQISDSVRLQQWLNYYVLLNGILPYPDYYSSINMGLVCPHLSDLFVKEYLQSN
jgi:hypothetical protein